MEESTFSCPGNSFRSYERMCLTTQCKVHISAGTTTLATENKHTLAISSELNTPEQLVFDTSMRYILPLDFVSLSYIVPSLRSVMRLRLF